MLFLYKNSFKGRVFQERMDNYKKLVEKVSISAGVSFDEVERRVEAKRAKLSMLVSKEGAAQIVAAELGVNLDKEKLKISELVQGMKRANVVGKIIEVFPVREFNKNGREGKVGKLILADESSNTRVVLWDSNHISLIENGNLKKGDTIEISNGSVRNGELHLSSFSDVKKSEEKIGKVVENRVYAERKLSEARAGETLKARAFIVQVFEPRYFEVCPECRKRVVEGKCAEHGEVKGEKRALLNIVIDDGAETIRCVLFGDKIYSLGVSEEEVFSIDSFNLKKDSILGKEMFFAGNIRNNNLYNTNEFNVEFAQEVNPDELVKVLESK
jgi:ssDNA-binding replication factor A large subunit